MRCSSCGYQNVSHASKCIKCNEPLTKVQGENSQSPNEDLAVKKTMIGKSADPADFIDGIQPSQGKDAQTEDVGSATKEEDPKDGFKGTINPWNQARHEFIEFIPTTREGQKKQSKSTFGSDVKKVTLNRDNLDPDNPTITRKAQAELIFDNGDWKLSDKSTIGTFIKLSAEQILNDGDQILMGDRIFTVRLKKSND